MLYAMRKQPQKTRVTFRVDSTVAQALREQPNQTRFVEEALREALGQTCPTCHGSGWRPTGNLSISDFKEASLPPLNRTTARQLREIVRLGKELLATELNLRVEEIDTGHELSYRLSRADEVLLTGWLRRAQPKTKQTH